MSAILLIIATLAVGYYNGANDVSKAVATLVGSGVTRFRTAVIWGSLWTFVGAIAAVFVSQGLVAAFSGKGILTELPAGNAFLLATAIGALVWIWFATTTGMPVSTTHALTGALVGAGVAAVGWGGISGSYLIGKFVLPLVAGPILSTAIIFLIYPVIRRGLARWQHYCVCVQQPAVTAMADGSAFTTTTAPSKLVVDSTDCCERSPVTVAGVTVADSLHWLSAGLTAFARGLNDAPKVLGIGIVAAAGLSISLPMAFLAVAVAMTAGSLLRGMKVTETLAQKVTKMEPLEGLSANLVTAGLVIFASHLALPVSTTHVSSGAIIGLGLKRDARGIQWKTVRDMIIAWIVTLPVAALVAALAYLILNSLS